MVPTNYNGQRRSSRWGRNIRQPQPQAFKDALGKIHTESDQWQLAGTQSPSISKYSLKLPKASKRLRPGFHSILLYWYLEWCNDENETHIRSHALQCKKCYPCTPKSEGHQCLDDNNRSEARFRESRLYRRHTNTVDSADVNILNVFGT